MITKQQDIAEHIARRIIENTKKHYSALLDDAQREIYGNGQIAASQNGCGTRNSTGGRGKTAS